MNGEALAAFYAFDVAGLTIKALAVVGGAVLGGLAIGTLAGLLVRLVSTRKMPLRVRWLLRSLGGLISGWILALFLFGGAGGFGFGGPGESGIGGTGQGPGNSSSGDLPDKDKPPTAGDKGNPLSSPTSALRVEVLGNPALERLSPGKKLDVAACYRIDGEDPPRLRSLKEIKQVITERLKQQPSLRRVEIVLYTDSPAAQVRRVRDLEELLRDVASAQKEPFIVGVDDTPQNEAPGR